MPEQSFTAQRELLTCLKVGSLTRLVSRITGVATILFIGSVAMPTESSAQVTTEVSRSAPTVTTVNGTETQFQGTYEFIDPTPPVETYDGSVSDATFVFPQVRGHMRAFDTAVVGTVDSTFDSVAQLYEVTFPNVVTGGCTNHFTKDCRTVFTNDPANNNALVFVNTAQVGFLGPRMGPSLLVGEQITLIERVLAGHLDSGVYVPRLGGVDRSTVAVIEASSVIPGAASTRPTMLYFGALDGMLHAVCAEAKAGTGCDAAGQELWAFIPNKQLARLRTNTQRIDGSPTVADVFDDWNGTGINTWRTILTFQTGSGDPTIANQAPAVYAMDITDPFAPTVVWQRSTSTVRDTWELGVGLNVAMGPVRFGVKLENLTFVQTNNGGTGPAGNYLVAYDTVTGLNKWPAAVKQPYPAPVAPRLAANGPVPATGIPGGVAAVDLDSTGALTHIIMPSLYGEAYMFEAKSGINIYGTDPIFHFNDDFHPIGNAPTIYTDLTTGLPYAVVASGGYADPISPQWAPVTETQYVVSFALKPSSVPVKETTGGLDNPFTIDLGVGNRVFAQAVVSGNELFVVTDTGDVNAANYGATGSPTGTLQRISLSTGSTVGTGTSIAGGGSAVDAKGGMVHVGSGNATKKVDFTLTHEGGGKRTELDLQVNAGRHMWLSLRE